MSLQKNSRSGALAEIGHHARVMRCVVAREIGDTLRDAGAVETQSSIAGHVRVRFLRAEKRSIVEADVHVAADLPESQHLCALVAISLEISGDAGRSSAAARGRIADRLMAIATEACAAHSPWQFGRPVMSVLDGIEFLPSRARGTSVARSAGTSKRPRLVGEARARIAQAV